ncbi:MAG: hypothetical protein GEV03_00820 [Streptosporangiales bacterium]|nr:hypothetical protein [Streptosporangiales bacterium]
MGDIRWESRLLETMEARASEAAELAAEVTRTSREAPAELAGFAARYLERCGLFPFAHNAGARHVNVLARYDGVRHEGGAAPIPPRERHLVLCGHGGVVRPDDAACLAGALWAAALAARLRVPISGPLTVLLVSGENAGLGVPWVLDRDLIEGPTAAVVAAPSGRAHPAVAQLGRCQFEVRVAARSDGADGAGADAADGDSGIPAGIPAPAGADSVIVKAAAAVLALRRIAEMKAEVPRELADLVEASTRALTGGDGRPAVEFDHVSVNIGTIQGGSAIGTVPQRCVIGVDCGLPFGIDTGPVLGQAHQLLAEAGIQAQVVERGSGAPASLTPASDPIVRSLLGAVREVVDPRAHGVLHPSSGDARWFRERGIPAVQYGSSGQTKNRKTADPTEAAKVYALTVLRYLRTD